MHKHNTTLVAKLPCCTHTQTHSSHSAGRHQKTTRHYHPLKNRKHALPVLNIRSADSTMNQTDSGSILTRLVAHQDRMQPRPNPLFDRSANSEIRNDPAIRFPRHPSTHARRRGGRWVLVCLLPNNVCVARQGRGRLPRLTRTLPSGRGIFITRANCFG